MKRIGFAGLAIATLLSGQTVIAQETTEFTSPNADVEYLGIDGTFTLDTSVPSSLHDPRNPARIVFNQMEEFSFYRDMQGEQAIAENCRYVYRGAAPDPHYYPEFQTSIWDLFELAPESENCSAFTYVALRSPHGDPAHMHFRYGGEESSFETLLNMSTVEPDSAELNPWWSSYCAEGVTACD
jgi:hypothetical protein